MIRRILSRLAARQAHRAAMAKVHVGLQDFRCNKASQHWSGVRVNERS